MYVKAGKSESTICLSFSLFVFITGIFLSAKLTHVLFHTARFAVESFLFYYKQCHKKSSNETPLAYLNILNYWFSIFSVGILHNRLCLFEVIWYLFFIFFRKTTLHFEYIYLIWVLLQLLICSFLIATKTIKSARFFGVTWESWFKIKNQLNSFMIYSYFWPKFVFVYCSYSFRYQLDI